MLGWGGVGGGLAIRGHVPGYTSAVGGNRMDMDAVDECLYLSLDTVDTCPVGGTRGSMVGIDRLNVPAIDNSSH